MTKKIYIPGHEYTVELRFYGENRVVSEVSNKLNLIPTNSLMTRFNHVPSTENEKFWGYDAQPDREKYKNWHSLEEGFEHIWKELKSKKKEILWLSQKYKGIWWCGHFQSTFDGGPTLSPSFLIEVATYGLPIYLDNYFVSDGLEV